MKARYLDIMARVVDVYTPERFDNYIANTRKNGIKEHGFPRLCANIGILMAHGRMLHLKYRFEEMIEICCRDLPVCGNGLGTRGNDFSVREVLSCILELEEAQLYPADTIRRWKDAIAAIDPKTCYRMVAPEPPVPVDNWAAFNAASEQLRCTAGLSNTHKYIENQIASQMLSFDENGMYRDPNDPMVYDLVTRNMLSACLHYGYAGTYADTINSHLRKAGMLTLLMQSVTGELPYGGRSNQFLHNEAHLSVCFEHEASAHHKLGNIEMASRFKAAADLALDSIEYWLDHAPGQHIKNYFPNDSKIGCENYAYYDKYMVTIASFLYLAYQNCDDSIQASTCPATENGSYTWKTGDAFRKLFCKAGDYFLEYETRSDHHYDAEGIGRIHRRNAPSAICLSVPVSKHPKYETSAPNDASLSICCGIPSNGGWVYGNEANCIRQITADHADESSANAALICKFPSGEEIFETIRVDKDGVSVKLSANQGVCLTLPALLFDGMCYADISCKENELTIRYQGWKCQYQTTGTIVDSTLTATNRNGIYQIFRAEGSNTLCVDISITPEE